MKSVYLRRLLIVTCAWFAGSAANAASSTEQPDNGTDPTRFSRTVTVQFEHIDLQNDFHSDTLNLNYYHPFGAKQNYNLRFRLPVVSVDVLGNDGYDIGDASLKLQHVALLKPSYAIVWAAEAVFDTAQRDELGSGKTVFKPNLIYARFLKGGHIFAPALVHSVSIAGDRTRSRVNSTVFDFYFVPKLPNPKYFATFDPALSLDWQSNKEFASLAVTMGRIIGPAFGGSGQVFIKPTLFAGGERPGDWGIEVGYKVIGF